MDIDNIIGNALRAAVGPEAAVFALAAIGLNLHYGYTGLLNFGQVGFMMVGGYGVAIIVDTVGWSLWAGIPVGLAAAAVLALILGGPTLRLRGDYFAITTIATAEILRIVIRSDATRDVTGGVFGLQGIAGDFYRLNPIPNGRYGWGVFSFSDERLWVMLVAWIVVGLVTLAVAGLIRSPWGRVVRSIREDEDAARSLGKHVFAIKMQSLVIGGVIGGLAGILFVLRSSSANAESFAPEITFYAYTILILGGVATRYGPILGAAVFWFLNAGIQSFLREAQDEELLPGFLQNSDAVGAINLALIGLALALLVTFRPQGILGNVEEMRLDA
jgi:branched-chain amino acid transport system permease protein